MDEETIFYKLGRRIKYLRIQKHMTQEQLAESCNLSLDYIGKIEVNINKPGLRALIKIANSLEVTLKTIFDFD